MKPINATLPRQKFDDGQELIPVVLDGALFYVRFAARGPRRTDCTAVFRFALDDEEYGQIAPRFDYLSKDMKVSKQVIALARAELHK